ncbi:MAG TPA: acyl-CoA dehydrogenase [Deltaproteobacteria bacterium]|nr:acyl-CoA dehydrogenase [Deltaproteobacteria bacterium]HCP46444.1 acyl-CoA dehydrogenase [Deltaproteobacteria bacterium]
MSQTPHALTTLTDEETAFAEALGAFFREQVGPLVHKMDQQQQIEPSLLPMFFEMGLMGIEIPEEYGGAGGNFFMAIQCVEEAAVVDPSVSVFIDVQNTLVINAIRRWGNDEQQARYLPRLARDLVGAYALSESSSGSDAFALRCRATQDGDDWLLNGNKLWITNANEAGLFIVFANTDFDKGYRGITAFLVEREMAGFTVGKKEDKLGIRASSTCELILENVRVPAANILGPVGKGYKTAIETLNEGRIGIGAQMVGLTRGALESAMSYAKEREQFGQPIANFQAIQHQIAQAATELEASRLMVYNAARLKDAGLPFIKEAAMAKLFSSQVAERVASIGVEIHGGNGFTTEYKAEKFFRDSKIGKIYEGTSNMQLSTIAKMMLQ